MTDYRISVSPNETFDCNIRSDIWSDIWFDFFSHITCAFECRILYGSFAYYYFILHTRFALAGVPHILCMRLINLLFQRYLTLLSSGNQPGLKRRSRERRIPRGENRTDGNSRVSTWLGSRAKPGRPWSPARDDPRERISTAGGGCELAWCDSPIAPTVRAA